MPRAMIVRILIAVICATSSIALAQTNSEQTARQKVVDYMRDAASIEWTPSQDIPYWTKNQPFQFKAGETYYGIPYTQLNRDYDLAKFKTQLKDVDGKATYVGPNTAQTYTGNDCSSCVSHAWRIIDPTFPTLNTDAMLPNRQKRIAPIGDYEFESERTTIAIVERNGEARIKNAYKALKPGDAVLYRGKTGHVMIVVRNEPEKERLYIADQTGCDDGTPSGRNGRSTMRFEHEQTYDRLFKNNYIPIGLKAIVEHGK